MEEQGRDGKIMWSGW